MSVQCPFCDSDRVQPHSVVHAAGTHDIRVDHSAVHNGQLLRGTSTGTQQSALARHCAPPPPPSPMPFLGAYGIGGLITYLAFRVCQPFTNECSLSLVRGEWKEAVVGLVIVGVGYFLMKAWHSEAVDYKAAKQKWQRTWFCHTCGQSHVQT